MCLTIYIVRNIAPFKFSSSRNLIEEDDPDMDMAQVALSFLDLYAHKAQPEHEEMFISFAEKLGATDDGGWTYLKRVAKHARTITIFIHNHPDAVSNSNPSAHDYFALVCCVSPDVPLPTVQKLLSTLPIFQRITQ